MVTRIVSEWILPKVFKKERKSSLSACVNAAVVTFSNIAFLISDNFAKFWGWMGTRDIYNDGVITRGAWWLVKQRCAKLCSNLKSKKVS